MGALAYPDFVLGPGLAGTGSAVTVEKGVAAQAVLNPVRGDA